MEWQQIISFYHLARLGSFTRAAEVTFRTQSALSQQIKNLEQELGCRLFERIGRKKLRITLAGEKVLEFVRNSIEGHDNLLSVLNEIKGQQSGRLRLAAHFNALYYLLPPIIEEYHRRFPGVELTIMDRPPLPIIDLVREGDVDFGFTMESTVPKDLVTRSWKKGNYILMAPADHPLAKVEKVSLKQVAEYPLILPPRHVKSSIRLKLSGLLEDRGIPYRVGVESSNAFLSIKYVEMGMGLAFFLAPAAIEESMPASLKKIPLDHYFAPDHIALIMRKDKLLTMVCKNFLDILFANQSAGPSYDPG
jgi:DNA-binding transcriptional LysR family regulator